MKAGFRVFDAIDEGALPQLPTGIEDSITLEVNRKASEIKHASNSQMVMTSESIKHFGETSSSLAVFNHKGKTKVLEVIDDLSMAGLDATEALVHTQLLGSCFVVADDGLNTTTLCLHWSKNSEWKLKWVPVMLLEGHKIEYIESRI